MRDLKNENEILKQNNNAEVREAMDEERCRWMREEMDEGSAREKSTKREKTNKLIRLCVWKIRNIYKLDREGKDKKSKIGDGMRERRKEDRWRIEIERTDEP